jgi:hypothetical protein
MRLRLCFFIATLLITSNAFAQTSDVLSYCNCIDNVGQVSPVPEGKFERVCKGKVIESGWFKNGNKDGEWVTYNQKGVVIRKITYATGKLNGKSYLFFNDGSPKLNAYFTENKPVGKWTYFTSNGKTLIEGEYNDGKPVGTWTINNARGNKAVVQYDFTAGKYVLQGSVQLHKDNSIVKNDNNGEYFFMRYPKRIEAEGTAPFGGALLANDLFIDLVEIPQNYWDTFINYEYKANVSVSSLNECSFTLEKATDTDKYQMQLVLLANTNPDSKIKKIDHSDFSRKMLDEKIKEALRFLPPWIYKGKGDVSVNVSYVINRIVDFNKPTEKNYN